MIAGKHTYDVEPKLQYNPEGRDVRGGQPRFTAKMLNHMD